MVMVPSLLPFDILHRTQCQLLNNSYLNVIRKYPQTYSPTKTLREQKRPKTGLL